MGLTKDKGSIIYASRRFRRERTAQGACCSVRCTPTGSPAPAQVGSLEDFLVERYLLYAAHRDWIYRGQVHHAPYPLQTARIEDLEESLCIAAGIGRPDGSLLVHYAQGVDVEVFGLERCGRAS